VESLDTMARFDQRAAMRVLKWIGMGVAALVAVVLLLDTFGGYLFDGPLGPIPGGTLQGPVNSNPNPDWSGVEKVIELEIRPEKPWSLSIWAVVVDGELYSPSAFGARRRWDAVAIKDPRVRVRTQGQIYERTLELVTDPVLRKRVGEAAAARYNFDAKQAGSEADQTFYFHYAPRTQ
jgi:hypothetical protein